ncbi:glycoside hydrolase family 25 protein [Hymenobacter sp. HD11105]
MNQPRRSSSAHRRRAAPKRRRLPLIILVGLLLVGLAFYGRYWRQLNRYARRTYATLTADRLTGREKTPLLTGYSVHGIDVSSYQGRIDWVEVSEHQVSFAFIKATEGVTMRDSRFERNWQGAKAVGIYRGAYHYFQPNYDGAQQADLFVRNVPLQAGDLPPVLDVEAPNFHDVAIMRRNVATWLRLIERHYGVRPILYSNHNFYKRHLAGHFDDYPLWLAHYEVEKPSLPREKWIIWQHSDESHVPGIRGPVDFNVFQGSFEKLLALRIPEKQP